MQAVVKKPHIKLDGEITDKLVAYLTKEYGEIEGITDVDDELVEVTKSDWYRSVRESIRPGENLRIYRELQSLTQYALGEQLGNLTRQNISNMAVALAQLFDVSIEKFL